MTAPWFSTEIAPFFSLLSLFAAIGGLVRFAERGTRRTIATDL